MQLVTDLRALGLREGDSVLVHSSLRSIGYVEGGAATVIAALTEVVGDQGTVLFPAHTGHSECSPQNPPEFDARHTPSRGMGIIAETARLTPGFVRSLSPTHSVVARGRLAHRFCAGHHLSPSPCGEGSPYDLLARENGRILLIGCDHQSNTSIHMVEEDVGAGYHMLPGWADYPITGLGGESIRIRARFHRWGKAKDFNKIEPTLIDGGVQVSGHVGAAIARLIEAGKMRGLVRGLLANDPNFLLAGDPAGNAPSLRPISKPMPHVLGPKTTGERKR